MLAKLPQMNLLGRKTKEEAEAKEVELCNLRTQASMAIEALTAQVGF